MKFSEEQLPGSYVIHSYQHDGVTINSKVYRQSLVVSQSSLNSNWPVTRIEELTTEILQQLLDYDPEVILIGTGKRLSFPHPQIYAPVTSQGVGIEFMDSGAVCRTYNILLSEDRRVVAAIII